MSKYSTVFYRAYHFLAQTAAKISWRSQKALSTADKDELALKLASGYYVIATGYSNHLSSVIVRILSFLKTGKFPRYTHVFMNCDNIEDPTKRDEYKFVEADAVGVEFSTFDDVFNCDYVCLLSPKNMSNEEWTKVIDKLIKSVGVPYDDLFDLADRSRMSCVEVVLTALEAADYEEDFANLEAMIEREQVLLPQMYRDCPDFIVSYEK